MQKRPGNKVNIEYRAFEFSENFPIRAFWGDKYDYPLDLNESVDFMHFHNCLEIGYCYRGEGVAYVEDKVLEHTSNNVMIIPPYTTHITKDKVNGIQQFASYWEYLFIDPLALLSDFYPGGFPDSSKFLFDSKSFGNILSGTMHPLIVQLVRAILHELRYKKHNYEHMVKGLALSLFMALARIIPDTSADEILRNKSILTVSPAVDYININYMKHINIHLLANLCHMSVTHFRRLFKSIVGYPPYEFINRVRVSKACQLLYTTEEPILEISLRIGYDSISSFNRFFLEYKGIPPLKWRNKMRAIHKDNVQLSVKKL